MLTIRHVLPHQVELIPPERVGEVLAGGDGFIWLDLSAPTETEAAILDHPALGLNPLAKEDMREDVHLPKLDVYADQLFLTVHAIELRRSAVELTTAELDVALGTGFLVTYHTRAVEAVAMVADLLDRHLPGLDRPVLVLHRILDVMDDVFVPFLDLLGQRLDLVEEDVISRASAVTRAEIFALRRDLITLRRISVPQAEVIRQLGREHIAVVSGADRAYFRDIYDHLYRLAEVSEAYRQLVESAYDMYRSVREDETNRRLTVLTMVSTVLLPVTTLAGIYGMNFEHMPELDERWAYPAVWAAFVTIVIGALLLFRSWGWLGREPEDEDLARRRRLVERLEIPGLEVLRIPSYGARFAVAGGKRMVGMGRLLGRRLQSRPAAAGGSVEGGE